MKQRLLALVIAAAGAASAQAHDTPYVVVIENDHNGEQAAARLKKIEKMSPLDVRVEIKGYCSSGCTLALMHPSACVHRYTTIAFHSIHVPGDSWILDGDVWTLGPHALADAFNNYLVDKYPPKIGAWIRSMGGLSDRPLILRGETMRGIIAVCPQ